MQNKLQALVYDILPSTTAVFSYAIGPRKLSANEQFFCFCFLLVLKQWLLCYKQLKSISDVCFITDHVAYASSNHRKPKSFESRRIFFNFLPGVDASHVYLRAWALGCFRRALTASVDSCAEIKSAPSVA